MNPYIGVDHDKLRAFERAITLTLTHSHVERVRLQACQSLVHAAIRQSEPTYAQHVTDHAIVRWLERFGGLDTNLIRQALMNMVDAGRPEVAVRDNTIVTVLPEGVASVDAVTP